jgi:hypothetical protein
MTISENELDRRLAALPRTTETPDQLWSGIDQRIDQGRWPWLNRVGALAAFAAAVVVAILVVEPPSLQALHPGAVVIHAEIEAMNRQSPAKHWVQPVNINGGLTAAWEENQAAIEELESALARNPDNQLLMDFLVRARLRQSELVNQAMADGGQAQHWSI